MHPFRLGKNQVNTGDLFFVQLFLQKTVSFSVNEISVYADCKRGKDRCRQKDHKRTCDEKKLRADAEQRENKDEQMPELCGKEEASHGKSCFIINEKEAAAAKPLQKISEICARVKCMRETHRFGKMLRFLRKRFSWHTA